MLKDSLIMTDLDHSRNEIVKPHKTNKLQADAIDEDDTPDSFQRSAMDISETLTTRLKIMKL